MEEDIPFNQCFEKIKVEEENSTTLKDALLNDMSQKMQGRCLREEQQSRNCSNAVKKAARDELEKQLRKCFSMPEKEEELIEVKPKPKPGPKPRRNYKKREVLLEVEEEGTETAGKVNKKGPFNTKRMTRGYIRDLRMIQNESEESVEVIEPQDALIQFDTARYRYDNHEISEMIG